MGHYILCAIFASKEKKFPRKKCFRKGCSQFLPGFIDDVSSPGHEMIRPFALPETSIEFTPQKRWLEDNPLLFGIACVHMLGFGACIFRKLPLARVHP